MTLTKDQQLACMQAGIPIFMIDPKLTVKQNILKHLLLAEFAEEYIDEFLPVIESLKRNLKLVARYYRGDKKNGTAKP